MTNPFFVSFMFYTHLLENAELVGVFSKFARASLCCWKPENQRTSFQYLEEFTSP
jgi:hypothetical protein